VSEIIPGDEGIYDISVQNTGNINDSYHISIVDFEENWDVKFLDSVDPYNITVNLTSMSFGGNSAQLQLSIGVPIDEIDKKIGYIIIEGTSNHSIEEQKKDFPMLGLLSLTDTMLISVGELIEFNLTADENEKYIMPGERVKYKVYVHNNGNVDSSVDLSHSIPSAGWIVSMPDSIDVPVLGSKLVEVFITAPEDLMMVKANTSEIISITGYFANKSRSVDIVSVMDQVYQLNVSVSPFVNSVVPGDKAGHSVKIANMGNGDDEVRLSVQKLELDWNITFPHGTEFILRWKEKSEIDFELNIPVGTHAGTYSTKLEVSGIDPDEQYEFIVETVVYSPYDIRIGAYNEELDRYVSDITKYVTPGSSVVYDLKVTNDGDYEDTASLRLYAYQFQKHEADGKIKTVFKLPSDSDSMMEDAKKSGEGVRWYIKTVQSSPGSFSSEPQIVDFSSDIDIENTAEVRYQPTSSSDYSTRVSLKLDPDQSAWIQVEVDYPTDGVLDPIYFAVEIDSSGEDIKPNNNRVNLTLELKYSDLAFDTTLGKKGLQIIGEKSDANSQLNISAAIRNIGEIDATNIKVALYIDDQLIDNRTVMKLAKSTSIDFVDILISFDWEPVQGSHKIEIKIDPDNLIIESNEENNVVSDDVFIEHEKTSDEKSEEKEKNNLSMLFLILIIAIIIIISIVVFLIKRRNAETEETSPDSSSDTKEHSGKTEVTSPENNVAAAIATGEAPEHPKSGVQQGESAAAETAQIKAPRIPRPVAALKPTPTPAPVTVPVSAATDGPKQPPSGEQKIPTPVPVSAQQGTEAGDITQPKPKVEPAQPDQESSE
jgi:uncharacterized membrane protein